MWILSAFGPGSRAPAQLFGGLPREQSFEEMRVRHYELAARGQSQQAIDEAQKLHKTASDQMRVAMQDVDGAIEYIIGAEKDHPNRLDICKQGSTRDNSDVFARANASGSANSSASGFGQPSMPAPGFGQPSMPGPGFRKPTGPTSAFGQTSSDTSGTSGFSQPSPTQNPFARASNPTPLNPFSRAQGNLGTPAGGFGASSPGGFQSSSSGGFGTTPNMDATMESPGKPGSSTAGGFGATASGGFGSQSTGAFGLPSGGGFGQGPGTQRSEQPAWGGAMNSQNAAGAFAANGVLQAPQGVQASGGGKPDAQYDGSGRLKSWGGKPVSYPDDSKEPCIRRQDGKWERIWFPDGPPERTMPQDIPLNYYDEHLEKEYKYLAEHGKFKDDVIPQFPPKWEWTSWDF
jgi:nucleoporin NUP42